MSQEEYEKKIIGLLESQDKQLKDLVEQTKPKEESSEPAKAEKSSEETHVVGSKPFECKDCNEHLKKQLLNVSNLVECDSEKGGCGAIVPRDGEKCPFCGNTEAKSIE